MQSRPFLSVLMGLLLTGLVNAQEAQTAACRKKLPAGYETEVLTALSHFPELQQVPIKFRIKRSYVALKTRPSVASMVLPRGLRTYVIVISNKTIPALTPITFQHMTKEARIGVIGHELSHVVDFSRKTTLQSARVAAKHLSIRYMDSLEYNTDKICLEHGLGKYLMAWSSFIRETMRIKNWRGADYVMKGDMQRERYMNPDTIAKYIEDKEVL